MHLISNFFKECDLFMLKVSILKFTYNNQVMRIINIRKCQYSASKDHDPKWRRRPLTVKQLHCYVIS